MRPHGGLEVHHMPITMGISADLRLFEMSMVISCEYSKHSHCKQALKMSKRIVSACLPTKSIHLVLCLNILASPSIFFFLFLCLEELELYAIKSVSE